MSKIPDVILLVDRVEGCKFREFNYLFDLFELNLFETLLLVLPKNIPDKQCGKEHENNESAARNS